MTDSFIWLEWQILLLCGHNLWKESGEVPEEPTSLRTLFSFSLQLNRFGEKWWILCYDTNKIGKVVFSYFLFSRHLLLFVSFLFCIIVLSNGNRNVYSMSPRFSNAYQWSGLFSKNRLEKVVHAGRDLGLCIVLYTVDYDSTEGLQQLQTDQVFLFVVG